MENEDMCSIDPEDDRILKQGDLSRIAQLQSSFRHTDSDLLAKIKEDSVKGYLTPREAKRIQDQIIYGTESTACALQRTDLYGPGHSMHTSGPSDTKSRYQEPGSHAVEQRF